MKNKKTKSEKKLKRIERVSVVGAIIAGILLAFMVFFFCVPKVKRTDVEKKINATGNVVNVAPLTEEQKAKFEANTFANEKMLLQVIRYHAQKYYNKAKIYIFKYINPN